MSSVEVGPGPRSALLIGVEQFADARLQQLRSPGQDTQALADVLADPEIGAFETDVLINRNESDLRRSLGTFFAKRRREELLLVYYGGHGLKDETGELYFAGSDTEVDQLDATAVSAAYIARLMDRTRSRRIVLLLDACYSGAFAAGMRARAAARVDVKERFEGRGRVVITSSTGMEYAFEGDAVSGEGSPSLFTSALIQGLRTGDADMDQDGWISVDELYAYVFDRVHETTGSQTPSKYVFGVEGPIFVARNIHLRRPPERISDEPETSASGAALREPTEESEYETEPVATNDFWTVGDELGYDDYAEAMAAFIQHEDTRPPLTIGVKGPWGAGKTSLMRMVQNRLDPPVDTGAEPRSGDEPRAEIRLTEASRQLLTLRPRRWRRRPNDDTLERVTIGTVLRRLRDRGSNRAQGAPLRAAAPEPSDVPALDDGQDWRPTVWFNPWMYQSGEQVWAGLAHEIVSQITRRMPRVEREHFWLSLNLSRVDEDAVRRRIHRLLFERLVPIAAVIAVLAVLALVALAVDSAIGLPRELKSALRTAFSAGAGVVLFAATGQTLRFRTESASTSLERLVREPEHAWSFATRSEATGTFDQLVSRPGYEDQLGFLYLVQTDMRRVLDLVATPERPAVVFVDDLDRCSPGTVCQVIEAINLFLAGEFPNCIFVIAMEPDVVAAHIEVAHQPLVEVLAADGTWENSVSLGWRFLDKIVQLPLSLPALDPSRVGTYLGGILSSREPAHDSPNIDEARAREYERAIEERDPSIAEIPAAAAEVQTGSEEPAGELNPEARRAMRRALKRRLRHDSPEVQAIVTGIADMLGRNPREIKRFVNVFRFYAFIRQERLAAAVPAPDTLIQVARLAVLTIRWPQLRGVLGQPIRPGEDETLLSLLESSLHAGTTVGNGGTWAETLEEELATEGVPEGVRRKVLACEDLTAFLVSGPPIGPSAAAFL